MDELIERIAIAMHNEHTDGNVDWTTSWRKPYFRDMARIALRELNLLEDVPA